MCVYFQPNHFQEHPYVFGLITVKIMSFFVCASVGTQTHTLLVIVCHRYAELRVRTHAGQWATPASEPTLYNSGSFYESQPKTEGKKH